MLSITRFNSVMVCCRTQDMIYFGGCLIWLWKSYVLLPWSEFFINVNQTHRVYGGSEFFYVLHDSLNFSSSKHWKKNAEAFNCKCGLMWAHTSDTILSPEWASVGKLHHYTHCEPAYFLFWSLRSCGISQSSFLLLHQLLIAFYLIFVLLRLKPSLVLFFYPL